MRVVVPGLIALTSPRNPEVLLTVAISVREEVQCTTGVKFWVLPSVKVPMALQDSEVLIAICGSAQLAAIETRGDAVTERAEGSEVTLPNVAVMFVDPLVTPVASPLELIVATLDCEESQLAKRVRTSVVASLKLPVAVYC